MKIVIGAMDEELNTLVADLKGVKVEGSILHEYFVADKSLVVAMTGIGLVNASVGLSYLLTKYESQTIDWILVAGTSVSSDVQAKQGDVLVIDQAIYSQANATGFGYDYGQIPNMPKVYQANKDLMNLIFENLEKYYVKNDQELILATNIGSADVFVNNTELANEFNERTKLMLNAFDMETTAYFQTAYRFNKPVGAIRVVSDSFFETEANEAQFDVFLPTAAKKLSLLVQAML